MPFAQKGLKMHLRQGAHCFSLPVQVMVTNVTSLLKTVKAVEDEATRGTRALEATIEYIKQELTVSAQQLSPSAGCRHPTRDWHMSFSAIFNLKSFYPELLTWGGLLICLLRWPL